MKEPNERDQCYAEIEALEHENKDLQSQLSERQEKLSASMNTIDKLQSQLEKEREAYKKYIDFLGEELSRHESMIVSRPYMAPSDETIKKGKELRQVISNLTQPKENDT